MCVHQHREEIEEPNNYGYLNKQVLDILSFQQSNNKMKFAKNIHPICRFSNEDFEPTKVICQSVSLEMYLLDVCSTNAIYFQYNGILRFFFWNLFQKHVMIEYTFVFGYFIVDVEMSVFNVFDVSLFDNLSPRLILGAF